MLKWNFSVADAAVRPPLLCSDALDTRVRAGADLSLPRAGRPRSDALLLPSTPSRLSRAHKRLFPRAKFVIKMVINFDKWIRAYRPLSAK